MNNAESLIGPHEGCELQLMLQGHKRLAYFQEREPEDVFAPYVQQGIVVRFEWPERNELLGFASEIVSLLPISVIYHLPDDEALRDALIAAIKRSFVAKGEGLAICETEIGQLLGYPPEAIAAYIARRS